MGDIEMNVNVDVASTVVDMPVEVADSTAPADAPTKKVSPFILVTAVGVLLSIAAIVTGCIAKQKSNLLQLNKTAESTDAPPISGEIGIEDPNSYEYEELTTMKEWDMATTSVLSTSVEVPRTVPPEKENVVPPVPYKTIFMWNGDWSDWSAFGAGREAFIEPDCPITVGTHYSFRIPVLI